MEVPTDLTDEVDGCYLNFINDSGGIMRSTWSKTKVKDSLAYYKPNKTIRGFKYTQNQGRSDLAKGVQTEKRKIYEGTVIYIREGFLNDGDLLVKSSKMFQAYLMTRDEKVKKVRKNRVYNLRKDKYMAIAVIPPKSDLYDGVKRIHLDHFLQKANKIGKAFSLVGT